MQLDANLAGTDDTSMMSMQHNHNLPHQDHPGKQTEHLELLDLVPHSAATHVAINDGSWFDPNTWEQGQVPGTDAKVVISEGVHVTYDAESDTRLETVRVDGTLEFAHNRNTKIVVDTFIASPTSTLTIGSEANPIQANKTARIVIANDGEIDANWDSTLISRGVITHGQVRIHGAEKLDFISLQTDASAGDNELVLNLPDGMTTPAGWQVGDQLVLGGTSYNPDGSDEDNSRFQDEVLTITEINGNRIQFTNNDITSGDNTVLRFDHQRPEGFEDEDLNLYIANTSRNVIFETENAETVPTQQRGHVMFMHNPDVEVQNAGFYNLGRTDKNQLVDDPGENVDGSPGSGTNPRGRYALHLHRTGAEDINSTPSLVKGNAIVGSPGWGIVHHDSHAVLEDNVVFDVVGSGIAAEAGNELGAWRNNITIKTTGDDRPQGDLDNSDRAAFFDFGFNGEGYWVQGAAQVEMVDNIAISAAGSGINIFSHANGISSVRDADNVAIANLPPERQFLYQAFEGNDDPNTIDVANVPLRRLSGFESYNSDVGIIFWKHMWNNDGQLAFQAGGLKEPHDARSLVDNFKLWNIHGEGIFTKYSTQIDFVNGLIVGNVEKPVSVEWRSQNAGRGHGISGNTPAQDFLYKNLRIEGFEQGIRLPREGDYNNPISFLGSRLEDSYLANNTNNLSKKRHSFGDPKAFPDYFEIVNTQFESSASNLAPTAAFSYESVGDQGVVTFDASDSFDSDPSTSLELAGNAIASYGWDFDNDGSIDEFGRQVNHQFDSIGSHNVSLTVWDSQGATSTLTQQVQVIPTPYPNLITDSTFSVSQEFGGAGHAFNSSRAGEGWIASRWSLDPDIGDDGAAVVSGGPANVGIGQIFLDKGVRRGQQSLSIDIKNTEGTDKANEITVSVWGVDGEFNNKVWRLDGPNQAGAIPMTKEMLLQQTVGGSTFDWTTFNWDVDFGEGYQFLVFQVAVDDPDLEKGDFIAIDNISIDDDLPTNSSGNGLKAEYYNNRDFTDLALTRTDETVDFNWGSGSPDATIDANTYSVRWTGSVAPLYSETYEFFTNSDDGVRLWVDDQLLIDNWTNHAATENSGTIDLQAGQQYDIRMDYYENKGKSVAQLLWSSENQSKEIIPESQLYSPAVDTLSPDVSGNSQDKEIVPEAQLYSPAVDTPSPEVSGNGTGLTAEYYNNRDFTDLALTRTDETVDFNWGSGSPDATIDANTYSVRWTGSVAPLYSETYEFFTNSDDGVRLWVDDQLLIDNWTNHAATENSGTIDLQGGQQYDIRMDYYENKGKSVAQLLWSSESQSKEIIPESQLYSPAVDTPSPDVSGNGTGLTAEYYNNRDFTDLALTRTDETVDFNWGSGSPDAAIDSNTYSVRWTGFVEPLYSETYQFKTSSDDGVRLWVNDQLLVDNWTDHAVTDNRGTIDLEAGQQYEIRMEYYENWGKSVAQLAWSSASQSEEIIPQSQLYAANSSDFSVNAMMQNTADSLTTVASGGDELLGNTGVEGFDNDGHSHLLVTEENGSQESFDPSTEQMTLASHQDVSDSFTASEVTPINLTNSIGIGDPFTNETVESLIEMPQAELLTVPTLV
ncbi:MAG: PA14 domain-containing protein [Coleofasciculus sp. B1-GNL1-01]|uniref:PA14 domain-containing protein n=1 Tax=Coleofasciculus sp. B1-GNL1-01 TaxID=3068484 RepID=UPI0032F16099